MVSKTAIGVGGLAVLIIAVVSIGFFTPMSSGDVTVTETQNGVEIVNNGDTPVTATVNSSLHTFNTTIGTERPVVVPVENTSAVTLHT